MRTSTQTFTDQTFERVIDTHLVLRAVAELDEPVCPFHCPTPAPGHHEDCPVSIARALVGRA